MNDYTGIESESKQPVDYPVGEFASGGGRYPAPVRIKTGAQPVIKLYYGAGTMPPRYPLQADGEGASIDERIQTLVYSRNSQDSKVAKLEGRKRSRPSAMSTHAKDIARDSGAILKRDFGKKVLFLTLTVPGSTQEAMNTVANESRYLMNAFLQDIRDFFSHLESKAEWFYVWEPQKRGMLHVHLIMGFEDESIYQHIRKHHRRWWRQVLENVSDRTGVDLFERAEGGTWRGVHSYVRTDIQKAKKDVSHYLAKYLQKTERTQFGEKFIGPTKWWGISKPLWRKVQAELQLEETTFEGEERAAEIAQELLKLTEGKTVKVFEMKNPGTGAPCGKYLVLEEGAHYEVYARMVEILKTSREEKPIKWGQLIEWHDSAERVAERQKVARLIHQEAYASHVSVWSADLCAPSSS